MTDANIHINILGNAYTQVSKLSAGFQKFEKTGTKAVNKIKTDFVALSAKIQIASHAAQALTNLSAPYAEFGQSVADLSAITGIAGKDLEKLSDAARSVGKSSGLGATQATEAFKLLASQISVDKIGIEGLKELQKQTILLSKASGLDLATAANSMAGAINQFGLEAKDAARVVNTLAAGAKYGAAEVPELAMAFKVAGVSAAGAGVSVESTVGAIEALSKAGVKGAEAGTALRNIMLNMQTKLGMDISGKGFAKGLEALQPKLTDVTFLTKAFGRENVNAAQFLIKNTELFGELTQKVTDTKVAEEQAAIRSKTFNDQMKVGAARLNDFKISAFGVLDAITPATGTILSFGTAFLEASPALFAMGNVVASTAKGIQWLSKMQNLASIATKAQAVAQWLLNAAMTANPIGLIVAGIALLVAGFVLAYKKIGWFRGAVLAGWEAIKTFGKAIYAYVLAPFKAVWTIAKGLTSVLSNVFTGNFSGAYDAIKKMGGEIKDTAMAVVEPFNGMGDRMGNAYKEGVAQVNAEKKKAKKDDKKLSVGGALAAGTPAILSGGTGGGAVADTATNITAGGSKSTKINVNIGTVKSADTLTFEGVDEGLDGVEEKIKEVLFRALAPISKMVV